MYRIIRLFLEGIAMVKKIVLMLALAAVSLPMNAGMVTDARRAVKATVKTGYEYAPLVGALGYTLYCSIDKVNHPNSTSWPWTVFDGLLAGYLVGCGIKLIGSGVMVPVMRDLAISWKKNFEKSR